MSLLPSSTPSLCLLPCLAPTACDGLSDICQPKIYSGPRSLNVSRGKRCLHHPNAHSATYERVTNIRSFSRPRVQCIFMSHVMKPQPWRASSVCFQPHLCQYSTSSMAHSPSIPSIGFVNAGELNQGGAYGDSQHGGCAPFCPTTCPTISFLTKQG